MELVQAYIERWSVAGYLAQDLANILKGTHPEIAIVASSGGQVLLSNHTTLKCTRQYYAPIRTDPNESTEYDILKLKDVSNRVCYTTQQILGINANRYDCTGCHMSCIDRWQKKMIGKVATIAANSVKKSR